MYSKFMFFGKRILVVFGLFVFLVILATRFSSLEIQKQDHSYFHGRTEDKVVHLEWHIPSRQATLTISNNDKILFNDEVPGSGNHSFTEGQHGEMYIFNLNYRDSENKNATLEISRAFLDLDKFPKLETLHINTQDGENPTCEMVYAPKGFWGTTIKNNKYKKALLNDSMPGKIKVRGNTSAVPDKKPYKLCFHDKIDMLELGDEYADKEWYLLPSDIKTYFGLHLVHSTT